MWGEGQGGEEKGREGDIDLLQRAAFWDYGCQQVWNHRTGQKAGNSQVGAQAAGQRWISSYARKPQFCS